MGRMNMFDSNDVDEKSVTMREIDKETRRARGTMIFQGCDRCKVVIKEFGSLSHFFSDPDILNKLKEHLIDLHGKQRS